MHDALAQLHGGRDLDMRRHCQIAATGTPRFPLLQGSNSAVQLSTESALPPGQSRPTTPPRSPVRGRASQAVNSSRTVSAAETVASYNERPREMITHVDAQGDVAVASVRLELLCQQLERDERDVRVVHRLQRDALVRAVEVAIGDELLDG